MGCSGSKHCKSESSYNRLPKEKDASKPFNVIILGGHKVGKSRVGNAILGRKAFNFWSFFFNGCVEKQGRVNGRFIKVVHARGWTGFDHTTSECNKKEIMTSVFRCSEGHVACVLVVSIDSESPEKDRKAAAQHMELMGSSVWEHTVLVFIRHKPDESNQKETDIMNKHKWLREKCGNRCHWLYKDNVNDLIEKLVGAATWYNVYDSCFKANNSAFSQESQMDSQCPEDRTKTENGRLQQENIELQQQATTSIRRGTTQESHHELSSASENTSVELREVFKIHVPSGPDSQQGVPFVDENRAEHIKSVTPEKATADSLDGEKMVNLELSIHFGAASQGRKRLICRTHISVEEWTALFQDLDADPPPSSSTSTTREVAQAEDQENKKLLERRRKIEIEKQKMAGLCRFLISLSKIKGPIDENLEDFKHQNALFVDEYRRELIERVSPSISISIADSLLVKNMIDQQLCNKIQKAGTKRMRLIYTALNAEAKKTSFLELLVQNDRFLVGELAKKKLEELEASNTAAD